MEYHRRPILLIGLFLVTLVGCTPAQVPPSTALDSAMTTEQTPTSTPGATPTSTPGATPTSTPGATPTSTPGATPTPIATATVPATPRALPTEMPTSTPTAKPDPQATVVFRVDTDKPYVAITIDDFFTFSNYRDREGLRVLETANDRDAVLTICPSGYALEAYTIVVPSQLARLRELVNAGGHEVCNHTLSHPVLTNNDRAEQEYEISAGGGLISTHLQRSVSHFLRPPFGEWNEDTRTAAATAGFPYIVMWSIDSGDWVDPEPSVEAIVAHVSCAQAGDIILMHANRTSSSQALGRIIEQLQARGLEPVTLSTLIESGTPVVIQSATADKPVGRACSGE